LARDYECWFLYECHITWDQVIDLPHRSLVKHTLFADDLFEARKD
jgi:hypothetical protein